MGQCGALDLDVPGYKELDEVQMPEGVGILRNCLSQPVPNVHFMSALGVK